MTTLHSIVTVIGKNKLAARVAAGAALALTHIALGSGARFPSGGETALENEVHRGAISATGTESGAPNSVFFDLYVPDAVPTFQAQEIGLIDVDGDLIAISRFDAPIPKFGPDASSSSDQTFRIVVVFSDTQNIVVQVDPVAGLTVGNLQQHLPFATDAEFADPSTQGRIAKIRQIRAALAAGATVDGQLRPGFRSVEGFVSDPPGAPAAGQTWIVGAMPTGAFAGHEDELAEWSGPGWAFAAPTPWMHVGLADRTDWRWDHTLPTPAWVQPVSARQLSMPVAQLSVEIMRAHKIGINNERNRQTPLIEGKWR